MIQVEVKFFGAGEKFRKADMFRQFRKSTVAWAEKYILNTFIANMAIKLISKEFTVIKDFTKIDYELEPSLSGSSVNFLIANSELW